MMVQKFEQGLNTLLRQADLSSLSGKSVAFHIKRPKVSITLVFSDTHVHIDTHNTQTATTDIYASLFQLMKMKMSQSGMQSLMSGDFYIKGDLNTARELDRLFQQNNIDWEEQLSHCVGDIAAFNMSKALKNSKQAIKALTKNAQHNATEFIQEEINLLPPAEAMADFLTDIDELNLRAMRLQAKIDLLSTQVKP
jgi:ubiquinone biosynthesis accessory factor UbiJ